MISWILEVANQLADRNFRLGTVIVGPFWLGEHVSREQRGFSVMPHRPANIDEPAVLEALPRAPAEIIHSCQLVLAAHPRGADQLRDAGLPARVRIIPQVRCLDLIAIEASARLVLIDSAECRRKPPCSESRT